MVLCSGKEVTAGMKIRNMVRCGLFAALLALCAWLSVPVGSTVFTLQTFGVFLTLLVLGGKLGSASIGGYILLGAVGLPVFSGFRGGIGVLAGVTGGYLWGFLLACFAYRVLERYGKLPAMIAGQITCYVCGCLWFYLYAGGGLLLIIGRCVLPYLIPDAIKIALAYMLTRRLARHLT